MSGLIICILHRKWGNKIEEDEKGGTFNMHEDVQYVHSNSSIC